MWLLKIHFFVQMSYVQNVPVSLIYESSFVKTNFCLEKICEMHFYLYTQLKKV